MLNSRLIEVLLEEHSFAVWNTSLDIMIILRTGGRFMIITYLRY